MGKPVRASLNLLLNWMDEFKINLFVPEVGRRSTQRK